MVGSQGGVVAIICNEINFFLLSCHYIAHCTNLAPLNVAKASACKVLSSEVDSLLNLISSFFNKSNKHKHALTTLQEQPFYSKKLKKITIRSSG